MQAWLCRRGCLRMKEVPALKSAKSDFTQGSIFREADRLYDAHTRGAYPQAAQGAVDPLAVGRLGTTLRISAVSTGSSALKLTAFVVTEQATDMTKRYGL